MGDVSIHLLLDSSSPRGVIDDDDGPSSFRLRSISRVLPADSSLSELMDVVLSEMTIDVVTTTTTTTKTSTSSDDDIEHSRRSIAALDGLVVIDASYHPPRDITSDVRRLGIRPSGPLSVTLHSMGWYPSGKLVVLHMPTRRPAASSSSSIAVTSDDYDYYYYDDDGVDGEGAARSDLLDRFVEWHGRNALLLDENFEYNVPTRSSCGAPRDAVVRWTGGDAASSSSSADDGKETMAYARPSEILDAVSRRSTTADASCSSSSSSSTTSGRTSGRTRRRRAEWERTRRLDAMLRGLEAKKSSSGKEDGKQKRRAVSEKVRSMLLKSRSEGDKKLRMEDRFHLEVVRLWDAPATTADATTSYRFYSSQTTAGKVASSVVPNLGNERASEFLVRFPPSSSSSPPAGGDDDNARRIRYRRLPNTMTLHDAQRAGWLREFESVLIRVYSLVVAVDRDGGATMMDDDDREPSKCVLDPDSDCDEMTDGDGDDDDDDEEVVVRNDTRGCRDADTSDHLANTIVDANHDNEGSGLPDDAMSRRQCLLQQRIHGIFLSLDENMNGGGSAREKKTKRKPASEQVRKMLIKSKSTGNARLKQEDRLYIEAVLFRDDDDYDATMTDSPPSSSYTSSYRFFSKQNDLRHIIATVLDGDSKKTPADQNNVDAMGIEFIVPRRDVNFAVDGLDGGVSYWALPASLTLGDAIEKGYVENFGAVVIRVCNIVDNGGSYCLCYKVRHE